MAFKKRYYKNTKKNFKNYKRGKFSKSNLYKHRTSKQQATQIYRLNKKVNHIEKMTKPEMQIYTSKCINQLFTTDGNLGSYGVKAWSGYRWLYKEALFGSALSGFSGYTMNGEIIRMNDFTIYGEFYNKNHNAQVEECIYRPPMTAYLKIIVCRLKQAGMSAVPAQITKPFENGKVDFGLISGPLISDISATYDIVKTKVIKVNSIKTMQLFKIKVKNPGTYRKGPIAGQDVNQNDYVIYYQYYAPIQFFQDGYAGQEPIAPICGVRSYIKFAFIDN